MHFKVKHYHACYKFESNSIKDAIKYCETLINKGQYHEAYELYTYGTGHVFDPSADWERLVYDRKEIESMSEPFFGD